MDRLERAGDPRAAPRSLAAGAPVRRGLPGEHGELGRAPRGGRGAGVRLRGGAAGGGRGRGPRRAARADGAGREPARGRRGAGTGRPRARGGGAGRIDGRVERARGDRPGGAPLRHGAAG